MAFDKLNMTLMGASLTSRDIPTYWAYRSDSDTTSNMKVSGYFNQFVRQLSKNDLIYIRGSDGAGVINISSEDGVSPVTSGGAITLDSLNTNIKYSDFVKFAGTFLTVGGSPTDDISIPGALPSDLAFVVMKNQGASPVTLLEARADINKIVMTFSADPSNDHTVVYQILRIAT